MSRRSLAASAACAWRAQVSAAIGSPAASPKTAPRSTPAAFAWRMTSSTRKATWLLCSAKAASFVPIVWLMSTILFAPSGLLPVEVLLGDEVRFQAFGAVLGVHQGERGEVDGIGGRPGDGPVIGVDLGRAQTDRGDDHLRPVSADGPDELLPQQPGGSVSNSRSGWPSRIGGSVPKTFAAGALPLPAGRPASRRLGSKEPLRPSVAMTITTRAPSRAILAIVPPAKNSASSGCRDESEDRLGHEEGSSRLQRTVGAAGVRDPSCCGGGRWPDSASGSGQQRHGVRQAGKMTSSPSCAALGLPGQS